MIVYSYKVYEVNEVSLSDPMLDMQQQQQQQQHHADDDDDLSDDECDVFHDAVASPTNILECKGDKSLYLHWLEIAERHGWPIDATYTVDDAKDLIHCLGLRHDDEAEKHIHMSPINNRNDVDIDDAPFLTPYPTMIDVTDQMNALSMSMVDSDDDGSPIVVRTPRRPVQRRIIDSEDDEDIDIEKKCLPTEPLQEISTMVEMSTKSKSVKGSSSSSSSSSRRVLFNISSTDSDSDSNNDNNNDICEDVPKRRRPLKRLMIDLHVDDDDRNTSEIFCISSDSDMDNDHLEPIDNDDNANDDSFIVQDSESHSDTDEHSVSSDDSLPSIMPTPTSIARPRIHPTTPKPSAHQTRRSFAGEREQIAQASFIEFNQVIFENKLPDDMAITWSVKLNKTAGRCTFRRVLGARIASIELSTKVIDDKQRLRSTLAHEMCHAAVWVVFGDNKNPHGKLFRHFGSLVQKHYADIEVSRCHNYAINFRFRYKCLNLECGREYGRHSKSINTEMKRCGVCKGRLELLRRLKQDGTPAKVSAYSVFLKENYGVYKALPENAGKTNVELMKVLGEVYRSNK